MTSEDHLIEQHILEYEARKKHLDELYGRAQEAAAKLADTHEAKTHLRELAEKHSQLPKTPAEIRSMSMEKWREETIASAGPMAIWDILAQQLEDFVERHE